MGWLTNLLRLGDCRQRERSDSSGSWLFVKRFLEIRQRLIDFPKLLIFSVLVNSWSSALAIGTLLNKLKELI